MTVRVLGVDAAGRHGWVGVVADGSGFLAALLAPTVVDLIDLAEAGGPALDVVAVDIPIGLVAAPARQADLAARAFVGPRRSSVFPAPHPDVVHLTEYAEVNRSLLALGMPRVSRQAFGLFERIREVAALAGDPRVIEAFPEASFVALAGGVAPPTKKSWAGARRRLDLLAAADPPFVIPAEVGGAGAAPVDDVLDAAGCAWSALRFVAGDAVALGDPAEVEAASGRGITMWV